MSGFLLKTIISIATILPYFFTKRIYNSKIGNYFITLLVGDKKLIQVPIGDNLLMYLDLQNPKDWIRVKGGDEESTQKIFRKLLKDGDVIIDAGANTGNYTMPAAKIVGSKGKVIAIEPVEHTAELLRKNADLNNFENIMVYEYALGEEEGESILYSNEMNMMGYLQNMKPEEAETTYSQHVTIKTLDNVIKNINSEIQVLKMDIEGSEFLALKGAKHSLEKGLIKNIICEVHSKILKELGFSDTMLIDFLKTKGYNIQIIEKNDNDRYHILASRGNSI